MSRNRPEYIGPPELFYNDTEARKYSQNSRMMQIQSEMTERALELLALPPDEPCLLLDIGCGSGLSGSVLTDLGHRWVGIDISSSMLDIARERECEGDLFLADMGDGLSFRTGTFDGALSISAVQWLCNADRKGAEPVRRLNAFFSSLYKCLARGARAILQVYPDGPDQMTLITSSAMRCGFSGGLVVDYPNSTKAKKYFLCLFAGSALDPVPTLPKPKLHEYDASSCDDSDLAQGRPAGAVSVAPRPRPSKPKGKGKQREGLKTRDWVLKKKERLRAQGKDVKPNSKYTGRHRPGHI